MRRRANAVRIDMDVDGKIKVWILDSYYTHGVAFYSDKFESLRSAKRFLAKYDWVPQHFLLGELRCTGVEPKKFRFTYPRPGQSATTYFWAHVATTNSVSPSSCVIPLEKAESADPTMRKAS